MGKLTCDPKKINVLRIVPLYKSINSTIVVQNIALYMKIYSIENENMVLLLTNAASYMVLTGNIFKKCLLINMFHIFFVAHLAHNYWQNIKQKFPLTDNLISHIKNITVGNGTNHKIFKSVESIPSVVVTHWSEWLKACMFYSDNPLGIKKLIINIDKNSALAFTTINSINAKGIDQEQKIIETCYSKIIDFMKKQESDDLALLGLTKIY